MTGEGSLFDVPPAAIGRFRVLHQVGAGTCGPVFRGTDPALDRAVAIKLFSLNFTPDRAAAVAAQLEDLVAQAPPLAAAVSPLAAGLHEQTPFLATSFAPGDSLDVALRQFGPAALEDLVPRLRALAVAMDAAAARGLLHGALHPRDVIVSEHDTVVTGLGVWPILLQAGVRLPARRPYRAPELTDASVSAAGDQFALAALAYEWMTGRRVPALFGVADMAPLPGADRDRMAQVFARALSTSPEDRYATCAEFVAAVADVAADADAPPLRGSGRQRRRSRSAPPLSLDEFPVQPGHGALPLEPVADDVAQPGEFLNGGADPDEGDTDVAQSPTAFDDNGADDLPTPDESPAPVLLAAPAESDLPIRPSVPPMFSAAGMPPAAGSGTSSLVVMALMGLAFGVGIGYLIWGRSAPIDAAPLVRMAAPPDTDSVVPNGPVSQAAAGVPGAGESASRVAEQAASSSGAATTTAGSPVGADRAAPAADAPAPMTPAKTPPQPRPAAPEPAPGRLLVRSTPTGATVFVDDERKGVTPATLRELALGTRRVRVQRDGYAPETLQVTLTRERPSRTLDVRMRRPPAVAAPAPTTPAAKTGTLVIESRPSGATALVNGRSVGATPVTIEDLAPGAYTVQMQLAGFRPFTTTVRVVAGTRVRAAGSLTGVQEPK